MTAIIDYGTEGYSHCGFCDQELPINGVCYCRCESHTIRAFPLAVSRTGYSDRPSREEFDALVRRVQNLESKTGDMGIF